MNKQDLEKIIATRYEKFVNDNAKYIADKVNNDEYDEAPEFPRYYKFREKLYDEIKELSNKHNISQEIAENILSYWNKSFYCHMIWNVNKKNKNYDVSRSLL